MRHTPIPSALPTENRKRLRALLAPRSLAVVNANDIPATNADGTSAFFPNSYLFYLTGFEQEETILLLAPAEQLFDGPMQLIQKLRIEEAAKLLETTDLPLAQIAADVGYCDQSALTRQFRAWVGITPGKCRQRRR